MVVCRLSPLSLGTSGIVIGSKFAGRACKCVYSRGHGSQCASDTAESEAGGSTCLVKCYIHILVTAKSL